MNFKDLKQLCLSHGFTNVVPLACDTIELKPEVRQMCASDSCHKYNKCWELSARLRNPGGMRTKSKKV